MSTHAEKSHDKAEALHDTKVSKEEQAKELEAIRMRLGSRRNDVHGGTTGGPYTAQDLGDAEWLLVHLDKALGHADCLTPSENWELNSLTKKRKLSEAEQGTLNRLMAKEKLTADEMVMKEYLTEKMDACLTPDELKRFKELSARAEKYSKK